MSQTGPRIFNGRYELHRRIGRGGMAEVHLARDQLLDRPVAVKVLFPEFATDPSFVERFRREAQAAANLNHPNIVGVYDWGEAEGTYFIVMEFVDGRSLAEIVRAEGPLHPDRAADVIADVAAGLGFAHRNGVVHRDVKPGNVLITPSGQVKVTDFGIARAIEAAPGDNLTQAGTVMGTATYFSPEQARGQAVDPRSDIYSLGCVLYELLVGRPPFSGDSPIAIAYKHVNETPPSPRQQDPGVPRALEAIVAKCLAKNPANRYPAAEDLRDDLRRFRRGADIVAEPVMTPPLDPAATGVLAATDATTAYQGTAVQRAAPDEPERRSSPWFVVGILAGLAAVALIVFLLARALGVGDDDAPMVEVPPVVGQTLEQATAVLETKGFEVSAEPRESDRPANEVISQDPATGKAEEGSTVRLVYSSGPKPQAVPGVVGVPFDQARATLEAAGFVVQRNDVPDDEAPVGQVLRQAPAEGVEVAPGSVVRLDVSSGPAPVAVPSVAGLSVAQASNRLGAAGFEVGSTTEQPSDTVLAGQVIGTDPPEGSTQPPGTTVDLIVSNGPSQATVPSVVGASEASAINEIESAGFKAKATEQDTTDPSEDGRVIDQTPAGGASAPPGSTVEVVIGRLVP